MSGGALSILTAAGSFVNPCLPFWELVLYSDIILVVLVHVRVLVVELSGER